MNLLSDPWIPIRRHSGKRERIAPHEIVGQDDPIECVHTPRPDFDAALTEYLIGLVQTTLAPEDSAEWLDTIHDPPTQDELRETFASVRPAFELRGGGSRYMQDLSLQKCQVDPWPISRILTDTPGETTINQGRDFFTRRTYGTALCLPCCTAALHTLQTYAISGGCGHTVSIRGVSGLATIIRKDTLWETVWANVLESQAFGDLPSEPAHIFPWLRRYATPDLTERILPVDTHRLEVYWAMPRRIWLCAEPDQLGEGPCALCGDPGPCVVEYLTRPRGISYRGAWNHPLSPYVHREDKEPTARKVNVYGLGYRHWLGLVQDGPDRKTTTIPAEAVRHYRQQQHRLNGRTRVEAWGWVTESGKASAAAAWSCGTYPLLQVEREHVDDYEADAARVISGSKFVAYCLSKAVRAIHENSSEAQTRLWLDTEQPFYDLLSRVLGALRCEESTRPLREEWHHALVHNTLRIFADCCGGSGLQKDLVLEARARKGLLRGLYSKKLRDLLDLPKPPRGGNKKRRPGV